MSAPPPVRGLVTTAFAQPVSAAHTRFRFQGYRRLFSGCDPHQVSDKTLPSRALRKHFAETAPVPAGDQHPAAWNRSPLQRRFDSPLQAAASRTQGLTVTSHGDITFQTRRRPRRTQAARPIAAAADASKGGTVSASMTPIAANTIPPFRESRACASIKTTYKLVTALYVYFIVIQDAVYESYVTFGRC